MVFLNSFLLFGPMCSRAAHGEEKNLGEVDGAASQLHTAAAAVLEETSGA